MPHGTSPHRKNQTDAKNLSAEALQAALRADLLGQEDSDLARLTELLEEAEARAEQDGNHVDVSAARTRFEQHYRPLTHPIYPDTPPQKLPARKKSRRRWGRWVFLAAVLLALAIIPAAGLSAFSSPQDPWQTDQSAQLSGHSMGVEPVGQGAFDIRFAVTGRGTMQALGAEEIVVEQLVQGRWLETARFTQDTTPLWAEGRQTYQSQLRYQGWAGEVYRVKITIFAQDETGRDQRSQTFQLTAE